jgi:hypothetical protein
MSEPEFRLVGADESAHESSADVNSPSIRVSLSEVFPLLATAYQKKAAWLADLADDPILISSDLAEILVLYRELTKERSA